MLNTGIPLVKKSINGSKTKFMYSKQTNINIKEIDVAINTPLFVFLKNKVNKSKKPKNINSQI